jgi:predicted nucleotidyltransferase
MHATITERLRSHPAVEAAWIFGSVSREEATVESDLDVAVLGRDALPPATKKTLTEQLAQVAGRPVDLIDLQEAHGPVLKQILSDGTRLFCDDSTLYADVLTRWWAEQADWRPYRRRILKTRRERWIEN